MATNDAAGAVLLSGATGFLGMELLARYLERTDRTVLAVVRAGDQLEATARLHAVAEAVVGRLDRYADRLVAIRGDLERPGLGLDRWTRDAIAERATEVVHAAASVRFTLPLEEARAINVEGTERMLRLAEQCAARGAGLRRFAHISTAYVAGTHDGVFGEDDLDVGQGFRNTYEQTKWEAERLVRARADRLPVQVFRPSIVVGERNSGWTPAFNVVYAPMRAFATRATLPLLPGRRMAPVDVVAVDDVADAIFALVAREDGAGETYTLATGPEATTVGELIDRSARAFRRRAPLTIAPALYHRTLHPVLTQTSRGRRRRWLRQSRAYAPYFALRTRFDTARARDLLEHQGIHMTPLHCYFDRLVAYAIATGWGKRPLTRVEAARAAQAAMTEPRTHRHGTRRLDVTERSHAGARA